MTDITLVYDRNGVIKSLNASGHAGFAAKGKDIVCAAETILLRTALELLENTEGVEVDSKTASRGNLAFSVETYSPSVTERLKCTGEYLKTGLLSLSKEYPELVRLREITEE